jgi:probable rRNA maturation factor
MDKATDVLSFPAQEMLPAVRRAKAKLKPGPTDIFLGDIVIARGLATRQARERGHSVTTELKVLALHGLLHLLGYDHERDKGEMARLERRLRRRGNLREALTERTHQAAARVRQKGAPRQGRKPSREARKGGRGWSPARTE